MLAIEQKAVVLNLNTGQFPPQGANVISAGNSIKIADVNQTFFRNGYCDVKEGNFIAGNTKGIFHTLVVSAEQLIQVMRLWHCLNRQEIRDSY